MRYQVQVIDSIPTYHLIDLQSETPEKRLVLESRDKAEIDWLLEGLEKIFELASKARLEKFGQTWKKDPTSTKKNTKWCWWPIMTPDPYNVKPGLSE
jgi:hypothetical protein